METENADLLPFVIHDLDGETSRYWSLDRVPVQHRWAFNHILDHDCGSVACGTTVYEIRPYSPPLKAVNP